TFLIAWFHQATLQELSPGVTAIERPFQKRIPTLGRMSELPVFRHLPIDASPCRIFSGWFREFLLEEIFMEPFRCFGMQTKQRPSRFVLAPVIGCAALFDHRNSNPRGQFANYGREIEMLVVHH